MLGLVLVSLVAMATPVSAAKAATCDGSAFVEVAVRQAPLSVRMDFSLADLSAMSARLSRQPPHPALGFYQGSVGYGLHVATGSTGTPSPCPRVEVQAQLVAVERRIEVGSELRDRPCEFQAAVAHYRHHADAASAALRAFATDLAGRLEREVRRDLRSHPLQSEKDVAFLKGRISVFLDASLAAFSRSLTAVEAEVDTPREVHALSVDCTL